MLPIQMLPQTMTVKRTTQTGRGVTTATVASDVPCSFDAKSRVTSTPDGPVLTEWKMVTFRAGVVDVEPLDRVTVAGGEYTVREVTPVMGANGKPIHVQLVVW